MCVFWLSHTSMYKPTDYFSHMQQRRDAKIAGRKVWPQPNIVPATSWSRVRYATYLASRPGSKGLSETKLTEFIVDMVENSVGKGENDTAKNYHGS